ncbi:MAG: choice-of-anchor D domain-containing protein [Bacteroidota bacterium]
MKITVSLRRYYVAFFIISCGVMYSQNIDALDFSAKKKIDASLQHVIAAKAAFPAQRIQTIESYAAGERLAESLGDVVGVLIKSKGQIHDYVRSIGGVVGSRHGDIYTALVPLNAVSQIAQQQSVSYIEASRRLYTSLQLSLSKTGADVLHALADPTKRLTGKGVIIGFTDSGINTDHPNFRTADGKTRILYVWDQYATSGGTPPTGFTYGIEKDAAAINSGLWSMYDGGMHGTHVSGIAAGNGLPAKQYVGMAPEANIIMVANKGDDLFNRGLTTVGTLDGYDYIRTKAKALGRRFVINTSQGTNLGPHDGTTLFEQALNNDVADGNIVCLAAGNEAISNRHASAIVTTSVPQEIEFQITGSSSLTIPMEVWYETGDRLVTRLKKSSQASFPMIVQAVDTTAIYSFDSITVSITSKIGSPLNGDNQLYITFQPTMYLSSFKMKFQFSAASGNLLPDGGRVDLWWERNYSVRFLTNVDPSMTFGIPAGADSAITVASYNNTSGSFGLENEISTFSGRGPRRDGAVKPDIAGIGGNVTSSIGSSGYSSNSGTSMSSPHVAGAVALLLQQDSTLTNYQVKKKLLNAATADEITGAVPNATWGYGRLNVLKASGYKGIALISLSKDTVVFKDAFKDKTTSDSVTIKNLGNEDLKITGITASHPIFTVSKSVFTVPPHATQKILIYVTPTDTGIFSGSLTIASDDTSNPSVSIILSGRSDYPPGATSSPDSIVVTLNEGDSSDAYITLGNIGAGPLHFETGIEYLPNDISASSYMPRALRGSHSAKYMQTSNTVTSNINAAVLPLLPLLIKDPIGDGAEGIDMSELRGEQTSTTISIQYVLAPAMTTMYFAGWIGFDLDQNDKTGVPLPYSLQGHDVGCEYYAPFNPSDGLRLYDTLGSLKGTYPVTVDTVGKRIQFSIPIMALSNDDGLMNIATNVGLTGPADHIPDIGHITFGNLWLSVFPNKGTVTPSGSVPITARMKTEKLDGGKFLAQVVIGTNDPEKRMIAVPLKLTVVGTPNLVVTDSVKFKTVFIGYSDTVNVLLSNNGSDVLNISNITVNNARFSVLGQSAFSLLKDASRIVQIVFTPNAQGLVQAQLSIISNDPGSPTTNVGIVADGDYAPVIDVSPDSLAFIVKEKDSTDASLTISNSGQGPLTWSYGTEGAFSTMVQLLNSIDQNKNYPFEPRTISHSSFDQGAFVSRQSLQQLSSSSKVLVIRNQFAWSMPSLDTVLARLGIVPAIINASTISSTDFSQYELIIVSSQQPFSFYQMIATQMSKFGTYVQNGGKLEFHYCPFPSDFVDLIFPGGTTSINIGSPCNIVVNPLHPVAVGIPRVLYGNSASHIQFGSIPVGANIITKDSLTGAPTTIEYSFGAGRILLTGMTWEFYYNTTGVSEPIGKMLTNAVTYMSSGMSSQFISLIPSSGTIPAGGNQNVIVRANARSVSPGVFDAKIALRNNDPVHNPFLIPVSLKVTGKPVIHIIPDSVLFGIAHVGVKHVDTIMVKNIGSEQLQVKNISVSDTLLHVSKTTFSLLSGNQTEVIVSFTPQDTGLFYAQLTFSSNDSNTLLKDIPVRGKVIHPPVIGVSPDSLVVSVDERDSTTKTLTILNSGLGELAWEIPQPMSSSVTAANSEPEFKQRSRTERTQIAQQHTPTNGNNDGTPSVGAYSLTTLLSASTSKNIVVWTAYCDTTAGGELENTLNAIKEFIPTATFDTISTMSPAELEVKLSSADIFMMPEQERREDLYSFGVACSSILTTFVQSGGTIISLDHINRGSTTFLNGTGLLTIENLNGFEFTAIVHDPESPLVKDVPATFSAMNGSNHHQSPNGRKIVREQFTSNNMVTQRDIGSGRVIYIGMDFYSYNSAMARLLANCISTSRGRNFVRTEPAAGTIAAGGSQPVMVHFTGKNTKPGDYFSFLNIVNNDPLRNPKKVPLHLHVIGKPIIKLQPDSISGITAFVGIPWHDTLHVVNEGSDQLIVTNTVISDTLLKFSTTNFTVAPESKQKILLTYTAHDTGIFVAQATIASNDATHPDVTFILQGKAIHPPVLAVTPDSLIVAVKEKDSISTKIKIENTGKGELHWNIGNFASASSIDRESHPLSTVEQIVALRHRQNLLPTTSNAGVKVQANDGTGIRFGGSNAKLMVRSAGIDHSISTAWSERAPMFSARAQHAAVAHPNGKIYVFGGYNSSEALSTLEIYDPNTNLWTHGAPVPLSNRGMSYAIDNNGFIYSIGGLISESFKYNPATNSWTTIAQIPTSVWEASAVKGYDGRIYVFGGERALTNVQIYDPLSNSWSIGNPMPTGRCQLNVVEGPGGFMFAIGGGSDGSGNVSTAYNTVEVYDPRTNTWSAAAPMITARRQFGACYAPDGKIYTIGGKTSYINNNAPFFSVVETYDPVTNTWSVADSLPQALGELEGVVMGGNIHAIGGTNGIFAKSNLALQVRPWISTHPTSGTLTPGASEEITTNINALQLTGGDYLGRIQINSNDPLRNPKNIPVALHVIGTPSLAVKPDSIVGITVYAGISRHDTIRMKNAGSGQLIVSDVGVSDTVVTLNKKSFSLKPGAEEKLIVTLALKDTGVFRYQLFITSNDSAKLILKYPVTGTAVFPSEISVSTDSLFFTVMERDSAFKTLTIHNNGLGVLTWNFAETTLLPGSDEIFTTDALFGMNSKWHRGSVVSKTAGSSAALYSERSPTKRNQVKSTNDFRTDAFESFPLYSTTGTGVHKINPMNGAVIETYSIPLSGGPDGIAFDGKWVYVLKGYTNIVYRFSVNPLQFVDTLALSVSLNIDGLGTDGKLLYVSDYGMSRIYAIDITSRQLKATLIPDTIVGGGITFAGRRNSIFASNFQNGIYEFNVKTGAIIRSFPSPNNILVYGLAYSGSADVLIVSGSGMTYVLNPNTGSTLASYSGEYSGLAADEAMLNYLTLQPANGIVQPKSSQEVKVKISASNLTPGSYKSRFSLSSNDPLRATKGIFTGITVTTDPNSVGDDERAVPKVFALHQNYPNPFNPATTLRYEIPKHTHVQITIYNILGKQVGTLVSENQSPGYYSVVWNGQTGFGAAASGIYFASIRAGEFTKTIKMVLLK